MSFMANLIDGMVQGRAWPLMADREAVRALLDGVYDDRYHKGASFKGRFQVRTNLQTASDSASYAGWITAENPTSGRYQGTSFVWFPGEQGSVAGLVIGTDGFGADTAILGRPGHGRRLRALSRLHRGKIWVKPDLLDIASEVPNAITEKWPDISSALGSYSRVIYAATAVRDAGDSAAVEDLLDLFFHEHGAPLTGAAKNRWAKRQQDIVGAVFPEVSPDDVFAILRERRFVVLEGPPGTGKTRLAYQIADRMGPRPRFSFTGHARMRTSSSDFFHGRQRKV